MTKHVHAEFMAQYAQDALETDRPWERWQCRCIRPVSNWSDCNSSPMWLPSFEYRRKPTKIQVAGEVYDDVVMDMDQPHPDTLFVVRRHGKVHAAQRLGLGSSDYRAGLVHTTYEGALRHAIALVPKKVF